MTTPLPMTDGPLTSNDSADNRLTANVNKDSVRHSSVPVSTGDSPVDRGRDGPPSVKPVQNEHQSRCAGLQATTVHGRVLTRSHSLSTLHTRNKQSCILSKWVATPAACFSVALRPQRRVGLLGTETEWEGGEHTTFNTLDNWGHKIPTQSKRKRTGKKRL